MTNTIKIFNHLSITAIVLCIVLLLSITYLITFDQNPPIEFYNLPFPTDKQEYEAGDDIVLIADYCRYTNVPYTLNLRFVDGLAFTIPEVHRSGASVGCDSVNFHIITVPDNLPHGTYYLQGKNEYQVNFLANRVIEWTSQPFTILP